MKKTSLILLFLYAILILALLVLVVAGARLYAGAVDRRASHDNQRLALAYIQSQTAGNETQVRTADMAFGQALLLSEGEDLQTVIYLYGGQLRTQLWRGTMNWVPEEGNVLCDLDSLEFTWEAPGLLKITAGDNTGYARCGGGSGER